MDGKVELILGRQFTFSESQAARTRLLVHLTSSNGGKTNLLEKFIIPNTGLDMPIYQLLVGEEAGDTAASLELVEKRRMNRTL